LSEKCYQIKSDVKAIFDIAFLITILYIDSTRTKLRCRNGCYRMGQIGKFRQTALCNRSSSLLNWGNRQANSRTDGFCQLGLVNSHDVVQGRLSANFWDSRLTSYENKIADHFINPRFW